MEESKREDIANKEAATSNAKKKFKKYSLKELTAQCKPDNRHEEVDLGIKGRELL